ncbi:MAG: MBL fold metallo-hydrolase [Oscillospiraceae bacterium]|nr:MBL fold metallo-hydrolase [Oscillospiraceae bacterium]
MHFKTVVTRFAAENCYIVMNDDRCVLIDPGIGAKKIIAVVEAEHVTPEWILLTHGHFDHIDAAAALKERYEGLKIAVHHGDAGLLKDVCADEYLTGGEQRGAAGLNFTVVHTPGHMPGSCCILCEGYLFSGDTLFAGDVGRVDLPGGSWDDMERSLVRLAALAGDYTVLPGHGPATTLEKERSGNRYMREACEGLL